MRFGSVLASILERFWAHFRDFFAQNWCQNDSMNKKHDVHEMLGITMYFNVFLGRRGPEITTFSVPKATFGTSENEADF